MLQHQLGRPRRAAFLILAGLALATTSACAQPPPAPSQVRGAGCVDDGPPQVGLPADTLTVATAKGPVTLKVQVADTEPAREKGLMFVRRMAPDAGMIFDFHQAAPVSFWMHNTYIGLDMLFVDASGQVVSIARRAKPCDDTSIPSGAPVRTVIELNAGAADQLGIKVGDKITDARIYSAR